MNELQRQTAAHSTQTGVLIFCSFHTIVPFPKNILCGPNGVHGGHWQVVTSSPAHTTVALLTCDGGEEMERVEAEGPELHDWLAGRTSSAD